MSRRNTEVRVQIYESEYRAIVAEAQRLPETETGGDLYGTFTHGSNPIIWLASGPGPHVRHEHTHFEQDSTFTTYWESRLTQEFGLQYIGSWHSHHFLGLEEPSGGDVGAAQLYARQHNRHITLEIIVNHRHTGTKRGEQPFNTTLRPYFYPNAQNAQMERFILATFVPLAGVSPIRQRLGANELATFNIVNWQRASGFQLPSAPVPQNAQSQITQSVHVDDAIIMPDLLGNELQSIADEIQDFNITVTGNAFLVSVTLQNSCILALVIQQQPDLRIVQVNLIDTSRDINENISRVLHDEMGMHFSLNQHNRGVLRKIVRVAPSLHRKIADQKHLAAVELELRRAKQQADEYNTQKRGKDSTTQQTNGESLATQQQLQEQLDTAQLLDVQRQQLLREIESLRMEVQNQAEGRKLEIMQLTNQLAIAQQQLADQQSNEQRLAALHETSTQQQEFIEHQLNASRHDIQTLEQQLQEAQRELTNRSQIEVQLNESQQKAQKLEARLADFQTQFAMQQQLEAQLKDKQRQLDVQRGEVSKLEAELHETKKKLEAARIETEKRRQHWYLIRNRGGPESVTAEENKETNISVKIVFATILLIVLVAGVAIIFLFVLSHKGR